MDDARLAAEQRARVLIDAQLDAAGWQVQDLAGWSCGARARAGRLSAVPRPERTSAGFLFCLLLTERRRLWAAAKGGAQRNISQTVLKYWPIRLPTLEQQAEVVAEAEALCETSAHLRSAAEAMSRRQRLWRRRLIETAMRGGVQPHGYVSRRET